MAENKVMFVLHRMISVGAEGKGLMAENKGAGIPGQPYVFRDARAEFVVRHADEVEDRVEQLRMKAAVDERVEQLRMQAAVNRRVAELRREGYRGKG